MKPIRMSFELNLMNLGVINKKRHDFGIKWSLSKHVGFQPYLKFRIISGVLDAGLGCSLHGLKSLEKDLQLSC